MADASKEAAFFVRKLRRAVQDGDVSAARRLVKGGIDINTTVWYDATLLHEAVSHGNPDMVKMLLNAKADVNSTNKDKRTALHIVCRNGNQKIFEMLVTAKADINLRTTDGKTCLHVALWRQHVELVRRLLELGADVNAQDYDGWTPLHWAVNYQLPDIVKLLLEKGATICLFNKRGFTPFHESISKDYGEIMKVLIQHGADLTTECKASKNLLLLSSSAQTRSLLISLGYNNTKNLTRWSDKLPKSELNSIETVRALDDKWGSVLPLMELCRNKLRHDLSVSCGHRTILPSIQRLGLPSVLQDYLEMSAELAT